MKVFTSCSRSRKAENPRWPRTCWRGKVGTGQLPGCWQGGLFHFDSLRGHSCRHLQAFCVCHGKKNVYGKARIYIKIITSSIINDVKDPVDNTLRISSVDPYLLFIFSHRNPIFGFVKRAEKDIGFSVRTQRVGPSGRGEEG